MLSLLLLLMLPGSENAFFKGTFEEAMKLAQETGKPVVVDVYTDWCGPCRMMDRTTFRDKKVMALFKDRVIAVKVNAEKGNGPKIAREYKVRAYPSFLILDKDGVVKTRQVGFQKANEFVAWVKAELDK